MFRIITLEKLLKTLDRYDYMELHIHHTYKPNKSNFDGTNGIFLQKAIKYYHTHTKGWDDIGQHVTLLPDGRFVTGRDFGKTPVSISMYNKDAFSCEILGNFDVGKEELQGAQEESVIELARYFYNKGCYIRFHKENCHKTCPGSSISKEKFMRQVRTPKEKVDNILEYKDKPILKEGSENEYVKLLQNRLNYFGFNAGETDGIFGEKTLDAVKRFQKSRKLKVNGVMDKKTWACMFSR
ncbi:peptidoglycan recognition protein family protein [Clostridium oryzae]|uniref:Putative peptidoglycan binding domain protein n=1 Tax=Clostridium oryzae TaxID=1450648 RepID=A0A1V4IS43_9CLOT|nr:peptidoglycan-binding domain-containing protein [Clostridium oryzae]OPJ62746.1 putative peptidoglycan binding domain protein [Clostridium oryzae]